LKPKRNSLRTFEARHFMNATIESDNRLGIRFPSKNAEKWLAQFLVRARRTAEFAAVVGIGSAFRGKGHSRSDVDLLVLHFGDRPKLTPPLDIDIRLYSWERVEESLGKGNEILGWAVLLGTTLFDREGLWAALKGRWADRIPLPSSEHAIERAEKSCRFAEGALASGDEDAASELALAALTQSVRAELIQRGERPLSRPELPDQLRSVDVGNPLAELLDAAMTGSLSAAAAVEAAKQSIHPAIA